MWTPNCKEPQIKMLCHGGATRALAVDFSGRFVVVIVFSCHHCLWLSLCN